jgi:hypothetical protein
MVANGRTGTDAKEQKGAGTKKEAQMYEVMDSPVQHQVPSNP